MAQEDYVVENGTGLAVRTDLNKQFQAIVTQNSGAAPPATLYPGMLWLDLSDPATPDGVLRMRNQANDTWLDYFANAPEFDALQQQVDANTADIADHEARIVVLEADVAQAQADIGGNTAAINQNVQDIAALDTRMDAVEGKNAQQDTQLGGLTTRMTTAETNITAVQQSASDNAANISALTTRVTNTENVNTQQTADITAANTKNTQQDSSISSLDTRVTTLEQGGSGGGGGGTAGPGGHFVGEIFYVPFGTPPIGTIKANGAALSRTQYADLFAAIGTTYGAGNGTTTFNVPDLRGEFIRGWDDNRGVDPARGLGTAQGDGIKFHAHVMSTQPDASSGQAVSGTGGTGQNNAGVLQYLGNDAGGKYGLWAANANNTSTTFASETRPRNVSMMAVICYKSGAGGLALAGGVRVLGEVYMVSADASPSDDSVEANGQAISRTTYAEYFQLVGTTYGAGDGSTTFNVPDLRGEFLRGWDHGRGVDASRGIGTSQGSQNLAHTHTVAPPAGANAFWLDMGGRFLMGVPAGTDMYMNSAATATAQSSGGTEARPRNVALKVMVCIKNATTAKVGSRTLVEGVANPNQTSVVVPGGFTSVDMLDVTVGGAMLSRGDFTSADNKTVTFTKPMAYGTQYRIVAYGPVLQIQPVAGQMPGMRNRLLNGAMLIDQRYNGAAVTPAVIGNVYTVDRFNIYQSVASKLTGQRVAAPAGFGTAYAYKISVASSYVPAAGEAFQFIQPIEGLNVADFVWGTAGAVPVAIGVTVMATVAGDYSIGIVGGVGTTYSYAGKYTLAANTPTRISIPIPGPTVGTWTTDNGVGMYLIADCGAGANFEQAAGAWTASNKPRVAGTNRLVSQANGAALYFGNYQLEPGPVSTPFEQRLYGFELNECQRYYETGYIPALFISSVNSPAGMMFPFTYHTKKRIAATPTFSNVVYYNGGNGTPISSGYSVVNPSVDGAALYINSGAPNLNGLSSAMFTTNAEF